MKAIGDRTIWDTVLDRYVNEQNAQEKSKILNSLCAIQVWKYNTVQ